MSNAPNPVITVVQCRAASKRLPAKFALGINGRPMLSHVLERAIAIGFPVWLATSDTAPDTDVAKYGEQAGVSVFRGSEWDVLSRFVAIIQQTDAKIIVRLTGDCPLLAPDVAREVFGLFCGAGVGIATNDTTCSGWPDGTDVEVCFASDLLAADEAADRRDLEQRKKGNKPRLGQYEDTPRHWPDREHVTPWIRRHRPHSILRCGEDFKHIKVSVDSADDLARVKAIAAHIPRGELSWPATRAAILAWQQEGV